MPQTMLAKAVAAVAAVGHDPARYAGQGVQQRHRLRQLVRLPGCDPEGYGPTRPVRDDYGLGTIAATRAAKRLTCAALRPVAPLAAAPAAFW